MNVRLENDENIFDRLTDVQEFVENEIGKYARVELDPQPLTRTDGTRTRRAISKAGRSVTDRIVAVTMDGPNSGGPLEDLTILFEHARSITVDQRSLDDNAFRIWPELLERTSA